MKLAAVLLVLCGWFRLSAQPASSAPRKPASAPPNTTTLEQLQKEIADLRTTITFLNSYVDSTFANRMEKRTILLDPATPGKFTRLDTPVGMFYISLESVEPYRDGFKLRLSIGNPMPASFTGFTIDAQWSPKYDSPNWQSSLKKRTFSYTGTLLAGTWNKVQMVLPDTKPNGLAILSIGMDANIVQLAPGSVVIDH